ncbi:hypothetical protein BASA50_008654 [Batrachochytrium salamandrivorans]|uniref:Galactose oxidase n=1 Tax=Batrachochytrium salamandrivorans TaxID=1357716 RepID=A0ABQ8F3E5_9FUNG|nr:hypothetical protein BASA50_008654 [Batrachochytrium salamandrivorans]KAH9274759.1 hypothetical protein BASA83_002964 [Batrachochytrium salamandrivorans]
MSSPHRYPYEASTASKRGKNRTQAFTQPTLQRPIPQYQQKHSNPIGVMRILGNSGSMKTPKRASKSYPSASWVVYILLFLIPHVLAQGRVRQKRQDDSVESDEPLEEDEPLETDEPTLEPIIARGVYDATMLLNNMSLVVLGGSSEYEVKEILDPKISMYDFAMHAWTLSESVTDPKTSKSALVRAGAKQLAAHTTHVISPTVALSLFGMINAPLEEMGAWTPSRTLFSKTVSALDLETMKSSVYKTAPKVGRIGAPRPRAHHSSVWDSGSDTIWAFGGYGDTGALTDMWALNVKSGVWTRMPDAPSGSNGIASIGSSMALLGQTIVVGCGTHGPDGTASNRFYLFDTVSHLWTIPENVGPTPSPRSLGSMAATTNTTALLFSGRGNGNSPISDSWLIQLNLQNSTLIFHSIPFENSNTEAHITTQGMIPTPRESANVITDTSGNAIVFGGRSGPGMSSSDTQIYVFSGTQWISADTFQPGQAALPIPFLGPLPPIRTADPPTHPPTNPPTGPLNPKSPPTTTVPTWLETYISPFMTAVIIAICACFVAFASIVCTIYAVYVFANKRKKVGSMDRPMLHSHRQSTRSTWHETSHTPIPSPEPGFSNGTTTSLSVTAGANDRHAQRVVIGNRVSSLLPELNPAFLLSRGNAAQGDTAESGSSRDELIHRNTSSLRQFINAAEAAAYAAGIIGSPSEDGTDLPVSPQNLLGALSDSTEDVGETRHPMQEKRISSVTFGAVAAPLCGPRYGLSHDSLRRDRDSFNCPSKSSGNKSDMRWSVGSRNSGAGLTVHIRPDPVQLTGLGRSPACIPIPGAVATDFSAAKGVGKQG